MNIVSLLITVIVISITITDSFSANAPTSDRLIAALIRVESNGNDYAIGDHHLKNKAYGSLQIRQYCIDDVNRKYGTKIKALDLLGNRKLSIWVCAKYLEMYGTSARLGREPSLEDLARVWNGGPTGYNKKSTSVYWSKVRKALEK
jgi:hypothetical protein